MSKKKKQIINPIFEFDCLPGEQWKPITNLSVPYIQPYYYISTYGRMYSTAWGKAKLKYPYIDDHGYLSTSVKLKDGSDKTIRLHRIIMKEFCYIPGCEELEVNHIDGNKQNDYIGNLEWCTRLENVQHAVRMGLKQHLGAGENSIAATTTELQADQIGKLLQEQNLSQKEIAEKVGVGVGVVKTISEGKDWTHIYEKYNLGDRSKERYNSAITYDQIKTVCLFYQDNAYKYKDDPNPTRLYQDAYYIAFHKIMDNPGRRRMRGIYLRKEHADISKDYIW